MGIKISKNNRIDREQFFGQYWGQKILLKQGEDILKEVNEDTIKDESSYLALKSLSGIEDKHAEGLVKLLHSGLKYPENLEIALELVTDIMQGNKVDNPDYSLTDGQKAIDYLRSKGYAIAFKDISVDDMLEYGWINLDYINEPMINNNIKRLFLNQYRGQKNTIKCKSGNSFIISSTNIENLYAELKPLSMLTDQQIRIVARLYFGTGAVASDTFKISLKQNGEYTEDRDVADYLRSEGFAVPYRGISVDTMINNGWIILKS